VAAMRECNGVVTEMWGGCTVYCDWDLEEMKSGSESIMAFRCPITDRVSDTAADLFIDLLYPLLDCELRPAAHTAGMYAKIVCKCPLFVCFLREGPTLESNLDGEYRRGAP
jgi:hypothetical protein